MNNREKGNQYEDRAVEHLTQLGYVVIHRNFRAGRIGEIDIIAIKNGVICFVEVKGRASLRFGAPSESISNAKKNKIRLTSSFYLAVKGFSDVETSFLIVEILGEEINIIEEVF